MSDRITADLVLHPDDAVRRVRFHTGTRRAVLNRWRTLLRAAWSKGFPTVQTYAPHVMNMASDPRVLFAAAMSLKSRGPKAPGPNGLTLEAMCADELWSMSTALGSAISTGTYRPGDERIVRVAKSSGVGTRPIVVSEVQDRVVAKAIAVVIRPMIDPLLDPLSFGFRPRRRREQALAVAEQLAENGYTHWVAHDFVDAFGRVPVKRLGDVLFRHLPCARLRDLAVMILPPKSPSLGGIKQGNPLSALALELYLNHFVDRPWRADKSDTRLIRYADDLLLMSRSREDAVLADSRLRQLSTPAGMLVKQPLESALTDIRTADAEWLGYRVRSSAGEFQVRLGTRAYDKLVMRLMLAHTKSQPARRAVQVLRNWSAQLGPMYGTEDTDVICERAVNSARKMSFVENISADELTRIWSAAAKRWRRTRREVRANPAYLATGVVTPPCPTSVVY